VETSARELFNAENIETEEQLKTWLAKEEMPKSSARAKSGEDNIMFR